MTKNKKPIRPSFDDFSEELKEDFRKDFKRGGGKDKPARRKTFKKLFAYLRPHLALIIVSIVFSLLHVAAQLLAPVYVGRAIDYMSDAASVDFGQIFYYVIVLIVIISLAIIFQYITSALGNLATNRTIADLKTATFKKLNRVPLKYIDSSSHGDLVQRVTTDAERVADGLIQGITQLFAGFVTIVGTVALMLNLNVYIALAVIILTPLSIIVAYLIAKFSQRMLTRQIRAEGNLTGHTEEYITNQRIVKLYNFEEPSEAKFEKINTEIQKSGKKAVFYSALINPSTRILNGLVYTAVCIVGAILIIRSGNGEGFTVGALSVFLTYALQYAKPFNEISTIITEMQTAFVSADRIFKVLEQQEEPNDSNLPDLSVKSSDVCFDSVSFSYTDQPFIQDFDLCALKGQHVAIVGKTGCGKSTIIGLLMRFYDIDGGAIEIDGKDINEFKRLSVRKNIGMVLQDAWLFKGTVKENIAYAKPDASIDEIVAAAQRARIDGFIQNLPKGYDTVLEPYSLSQGQQQLLCIARVFLSLPEIIILDEATSSIDARTELKIQSALKEMTSGHTSFIVAHRLSTIKNADLIIVMEAGKIIEKGTHAQLYEANGKYREMLSAFN